MPVKIGVKRRLLTKKGPDLLSTLVLKGAVVSE